MRSRSNPHTLRPQVPDGTADVARRFGVTVKALRLYERLGLLTPKRDEIGWRTYGDEDCARLHRILSLRQLGLSLAAISALARTRGQGLADILELQETALVAQQAKTEEALAILRRAKARVAAGETLDADALAELVRRVQASRLSMSAEVRAISARTLSRDQRERLAMNSTPDLAVQWAEFYQELEGAMASGNPHDPAALAMARRANGLIDQMTGGDPVMRLATRNFWVEGLADPEAASHLPITAAQWAFLGAAIARLAETIAESKRGSNEASQGAPE